MALGVFFLSFIGTFDDIYDGVILSDGNIVSDVLETTINKLSERKLTIDTAYYAWLASCSFIAYSETVSMFERLKDLGYYLCSQLFGSGVYHSKLTSITRYYYLHYNGGLWPIYFYYYFGPIGVTISGWLISKYLSLVNRVIEDGKDFVKICGVYVVTTMPRWYLYEPTSLFRGIFFLTVIYGITKLLNNAGGGY